MNKGKALIFSAPSGAGKTTIVHHLIQKHPNLAFSISATTRKRRDNEVDGVDYHFLSPEEFRKKVDEDAFLEWEEVYSGHYYGTLKSEVDKIWKDGHHVIFDVDVEGGLSLKQALADRALAVFVKVSDLETLRKRLESRRSESSSTLAIRLEKAGNEMLYESQFDRVVVNDEIHVALAEAEKFIGDFLSACE